uniref:Uncharacterized protein n=1 Tax=Timema monikensis TaxID=170555 RepID=A0A7R9HV78_9NEOP|nr:unnamed protein product [Timema monikensis]
MGIHRYGNISFIVEWSVSIGHKDSAVMSVHQFCPLLCLQIKYDAATSDVMDYVTTRPTALSPNSSFSNEVFPPSQDEDELLPGAEYPEVSSPWGTTTRTMLTDSWDQVNYSVVSTGPRLRQLGPSQLQHCEYQA